MRCEEEINGVKRRDREGIASKKKRTTHPSAAQVQKCPRKV